MAEENKIGDNFFRRIFRKFSQFCFLSFKNANKNMIWESAASCAFGFIFSFIPVVLIIFTVLVTVLKLSPDILNYVIVFSQQFESFYDFKPLINSVLKMKSISIIDIFLGVWVVWMARKLFLSMITGIGRIFRSVSTRMSSLNQIFSIISEFVLVLIFILVVLFSFLFNKLTQLPFLKVITSSFPILFSTGSNRIVIFITYLLFFIFGVYAYKFLSGAKPKWHICIFYSALATFIMFFVSFFINKFMHFTNYNIVYGAVSTLVVMLFKVYLFFGIFLFCAQMLYVSEYFENLIFCELYEVQDGRKSQINDILYSTLFKNPVFSDVFPTKKYKNDEKIFYDGAESNFVFYVKKGIVLDVKINQKEDVSKTYRTGDFFGEQCVILGKKRQSEAVSLGESEICFISKDIFLKIMKDYPNLCKIALEKM